MLSFRQKIFLGYAIAFLFFIALMYSFASTTVSKIVGKAMESRANELIEKIQTAPNDEALVRRLKDQKSQTFFRVSVITDQMKVLYDSHTKRLLGPRFSQEHISYHPEVVQAFEHGVGYHADYSELLGQEFSYMAKSFDFHGKTYVLRTAFPYKYVVELTHDFEIGFLGLGSGVLLLFSVMTWFIIYHLTRPIQQIIKAVKPYQEGSEHNLPEIHIKVGAKDDIGKLASTLNSLSERIRSHIDNLVHERNEKEAILESLVEGVVAVDNQMMITYVNNMSLKMLEWPHQLKVGDSFLDTLEQKCIDLLALCQQEGKPQTEMLIIKKEGGKHYLDIVAAPKKQESGAILVIQDKTSHYKILEMRKDFIANASHELKTPVTIIRGFAETLHDNPDLPQEITREATNKIVRNCQRMTLLIKDLLTLADIENIPHSRLIECDLSELIENCASILLDAFPDTVLTVEKKSDEPFLILADPHLMDMAIMNLMENAAKYSNKPAKVTVTLSHVDNKIKLQVADEGIGIPPADLEHIFQRFYTVNKAHSQKMGGSGLGLSIVETVIEKHYGTITVKSETGKGTTFTVLLPVFQSEDEGEPSDLA